MKFISTQQQAPAVDLKTAVFASLPADKGLYLPEHLPQIPTTVFAALPTMSFAEIACEIAQLFLGDDIPARIIREITLSAFDFTIEIHEINDYISCLELFHGPTCAFKDFAARFMARLMSFLQTDCHEPLTILVATSGDTGGAVADAFYQVKGINVVILYPDGKVSALQEKQLTSYGNNIRTIAVNGSFDDCQALVKRAFHDPELNQQLRLSSANSINIARLIPQTFYYVYAYAQLQALQQPLVVSVPSGNFGNLTAAVMAKKIGVPFAHFIAACNSNDTVVRYLQHGVYTPQPTQQTIANAMDVADPSNFQRLNYLYDHNLEALRSDITAYAFDDPQLHGAIADCYAQYGYILDPHTAAGYLGLQQFGLTNHHGILVATAHPAKFIDIYDIELVHKIKKPAQLEELASHSINRMLIDNDYSDFLNSIT